MVTVVMKMLVNKESISDLFLIDLFMYVWKLDGVFITRDTGMSLVLFKHKSWAFLSVGKYFPGIVFKGGN